ncbi:hypothetical protein FOL47_004191 [Perkinsus chesapeaki]|uniref:Transmembrane protein 256 n=1 Tax=Perkinsus chesapeaki TaxID=330153 RepID=A0A7J6MZ97_PERCH|nr:hypothetical protein FOL47_004191 [Perkinsus chesapeaki]
MLWHRIGCIGACTGVLIDAFGGHGLRSKPNITPRDIEVWQTAARYQMVHSVAIIIASALYRGSDATNYPAILFSIGTLFFSGSLYALVLTGVKRLGIITPIGGLLMAGGWFAMAF